MSKPKLILLYGFAGIGKTTIAKRYADEHALAMNLDQDKIISMLGLWPEHEEHAWKLVAELCKTLAMTYLERDHDVVVPCLPTGVDRVQDYENIAQKSHAALYEVTIAADRKIAVQRLLKRGAWSEEGLPHITTADIPAIEKLYDSTQKVLASRPNAVEIPFVKDGKEVMYRQFLRAVGRHITE